MHNPWFRLYAEFATDPVVQSLAFEDQRHFVVVMCMKCSGILDRKMTKDNRERIIARGLGLDRASADEVKRRLMEVDFINKNWQPKAWEKRQFISDNVTQRTRKYRKNKELGNVPGTPKERFGNGPDTEQNRTETEQRSRRTKFAPPSVEEVIAYCRQRENSVDPHRFVDFYQSKGWKVGSEKMADWKAAVRTWERREPNQTQPQLPDFPDE